MMRCGCFRKAAEDNTGESSGIRVRDIAHSGDRDLGSLLGGKAMDAGRDRRKSDRPQRMMKRELQRRTVGGGEQRVLAVGPCAPDRTNGVDHVASGKAITFGDARLA